jgi:hypothetical protein
MNIYLVALSRVEGILISILQLTAPSRRAIVFRFHSSSRSPPEFSYVDKLPICPTWQV